MPLRLDYGTIEKPVRTPQGGLRAPALLTRSGVFTYHRADGTPILEYRPEEEVFRADSLAGLVAAPVTNLHPPEMVSADNYRTYAVGHVGDGVKRDGHRVAADLIIQDKETVDAIDAKQMRQVSCGYECDIDETPGVSPDNVKYDRVQRNIRYNHVAIVPQGRAGAEIALRLDAQDNALPIGGAHTRKDPDMKIEIIGGVEYDVGSPGHRDACARRDAETKARADASQADATARQALQAKHDALAADKAKLEADLVAARDAKRIDALVTARAELLTLARGILGAEVKLDGLDGPQIKKAIATHAYPSIKLDGQEPAYVSALYDAAVAKHREDPEFVGSLRVDAEIAALGGSGGAELDPVSKSRLDMIERTRKRAEEPFATSTVAKA